jgi:hypothetical protein
LEAQDHASITVALRRQSEVLSFSGAVLTGDSGDLRVSIMAFQSLTEGFGSCDVHDASSAVKTIVKNQTRAMAPPPSENRESAALSLPDMPEASQLCNCI